MQDRHAIDKIGNDEFNALYKHYDDIITNTRLRALNEQRHDMLETVKARGKETYLTKSELVTLMEWKLHHGKFRPMLSKLVQENDDGTVQKVTKEAFQVFSKSSPPAEAQVKDSISRLSTFRGVGPATASLLLSTYDPENAPFFSDELFRWCFWESGRGTGWDRDIKYNTKEYLQLFEAVRKLKDRLAISCLDIEKAAYVLARQFPGESGSTTETTVRKRKATQEAETADQKADKIQIAAKKPKQVKQANKEDSILMKRSTRSSKKT